MHQDVLLDMLRQQISNPETGLGEKIFLFVSELTPLVNTDLLVRDDYGRILLAWRNDPWWGSGWHVPGGVLRLHETFLDRIMKTAATELHTSVTVTNKPLEIRPIIAKEFKQRSHHITFVYGCSVPKGYRIDNGTLGERDTGYLAWHGKCPEQLLKCHEFYRKYFKDSG